MEDVTDVLATIADNLNSGNIKFVVLMDKLHNRLKDLRIILKKDAFMGKQITRFIEILNEEIK